MIPNNIGNCVAMICNDWIRAYMLVCCMILHVNIGDGQTIQDIRNLLDDKLADYNINIRPVANQSQPLDVHIGFDLITIIDVDEISQTVIVNAIFPLTWTDDSMTWNPDDYNGLYSITAKNELFWKPPLVHTTSNNIMKTFGGSWNDVRVFSNGQIYYFPAEILYNACEMDLTYFPFDRQKCEFIFNPWGLPQTELVMHGMASEVSKTYFRPNGAWDLVGSEILLKSARKMTQDLAVILYIQRLPTFVVLNVIVPIIILSILNILVFFIPTDSGERISYCLTLLLSIAVFLTIVSDDLPNVSTPTPVLCYYLLTVLLLSAAITTAISISLRLYFTDEAIPVGTTWKRLVRLLRCKSITCKVQKHTHDQDVANPTHSNLVHPIGADFDGKEHVNDDSRSNADMPKKMWLTETIVKNEEVSKSDFQENTDANDRFSWKQVSVAFDKACCLVISILLILTTVVMFGVLVNTSR